MVGSTTGIIVEDCVSALKVSLAGVGDGIPCFSSNISKEKLARLSRVYGKLVVWLDSDKYREAVGLSTRAKMLGCESQAVFTEEDPKCYNLNQIKDLLHNE